MTLRYAHTALLAASLLAGSAGAALAQQFLYTPQPPAGSAYVRFVSGLDAAAQVAPGFLPAQTLGTGTTDRVGAYAVVQKVAGRPLTFDVNAGSRSGHASITASAGGFVTVILAPDGAAGIKAMPVNDETDFNQTKSHLAFYNATPSCTGGVLKLLPASANVFTDVHFGTAKARSVNPVTASVVPSCDGTTAPTVALQGLEAGGMYSIWLMQPGTQALSFISRDTTLPYKP